MSPVSTVVAHAAHRKVVQHVGTMVVIVAKGLVLTGSLNRPVNIISLPTLAPPLTHPQPYPNTQTHSACGPRPPLICNDDHVCCLFCSRCWLSYYTLPAPRTPLPRGPSA